MHPICFVCSAGFELIVLIYIYGKHFSSVIVLDSLLVNLIKQDDLGYVIKWMYIV